jgi:hypothetical protein
LCKLLIILFELIYFFEDEETNTAESKPAVTIKSNIEVPTIIPYSDDLLDVKSDLYKAESAKVEEIFREDLETTATDNDLTITKMTVIFRKWLNISSFVYFLIFSMQLT